MIQRISFLQEFEEFLKNLLFIMYLICRDRSITKSTQVLFKKVEMNFITLERLFLSDSNKIRIHNHLVYKRTLSHLACFEQGVP